MRITSRYVFRQAAGALVLILSSLSGVVWIALALRQLNVVTSQGQDVWRLLAMTTLALPNLMALIAPIALLIATIHTLNRLNGDSELIVLTAAGAPVWAIARPLLLLALLVSTGVSAVNHYVLPWSLRLLREMVIEVRTDLLTQVIQPGRFTSPEQSLTFHIRDRAMNGELLGILMHDTRDPKQALSYLAERGLIIKQNGAAYLMMMQGHIMRRPDPNEPVQIIEFDRYAVDLDRFETKESGGDLKPRERYTTELWRPDPNDETYKQFPGQLIAELHERIANPLYPLAFVLIAAAFVGHAESTRQNRMQSVILAFLLAAAVRMGGLALNNVVVIRPRNAYLMYALPLTAIVLALVLIVLRARPRSSGFRLSLPWSRAARAQPDAPAHAALRHGGA